MGNLPVFPYRYCDYIQITADSKREISSSVQTPLELRGSPPWGDMTAPCLEIRSRQTRRHDPVQPSHGTAERFRAFPPVSFAKESAGVPIKTHRRASPVTNPEPIAIGLDASSREMHNGPLRNRRMRNLSTLFAVASLPCIRIIYLHRRTHAPLPATALRYNPPRVELLTLPFMLCSTVRVYNCRGRQTAAVPSDGESCIPMPNLMQLRAATTTWNRSCCRRIRLKGPLPNQQPRRGLV